MSDVKHFVSVTDRSTKAITTAVGNLSKVASELQTLASSSEAIAQEIQFRQGELNQINTDFDQKLAEAKSDLRIKVLDNEDKVLEQLLKARGLTTIAPSELVQLKSNLEEAEASNDEAIRAAVEQANTAASNELRARLAQQASEHKVAIAELNANGSAKDQKIAFLTEQVEELRKTVTAERETRVKIAEAEAQRAGVTINQGKQ